MLFGDLGKAFIGFSLSVPVYYNFSCAFLCRWGRGQSWVLLLGYDLLGFLRQDLSLFCNSANKQGRGAGQ